MVSRATVERIARDPDSLADLAADAASARADWFGEFTTEAHIVVSGTWPPGYDPEGPEELFGERTDLGDPAALHRCFPRLAAFRRDIRNSVSPSFADPDRVRHLTITGDRAGKKATR